jgi:hypothetical protein
MASYFYLRGGKQHGPFTLNQMQQLASAGQLSRDDLIRRPDEEGWVSADQATELRFASAEVEPAEPPPRTTPAGPPPVPPRRESTAGEAPHAPASSDKVTAVREAATRAWSRTRVAAERGIDAVQKATGVPKTTVVALLAGVAALVLLMMCTLPTWYAASSGVNMFQTEFVDSVQYVGLSYTEGKLVVILSIGALVWCGLGLLRRQWLPSGLLVAGGVGTCSLVMLLGLRSRIAADVAEVRRVFEELRNMPMFKEFYDQADWQAMAYVGFALNSAILFSGCAAAAFCLASVREPQPLRFFPDKGPLVERYGWLVGSQILAFLLGVIIAVWQR